MEQIIMEIQALKQEMMSSLRLITSFAFGTWIMTLAFMIKSLTTKEK
jgi:hypothetical protein